ncbi:MAG: TPM domain-containing protein, partial [Crocinitomicaceae bacterium]
MLTNQELEQVERTISEAEKKTSGEIRVHIDSFCETDPYQRGVDIFHELRMNETEERNGILIYIDFTHRKLAIVGDEGI